MIVDVVFYSLLTVLWCVREWGLLFSWKSEWKTRFVGFFQKPPGGSRGTARWHTHQNQFLGISDEPPGGTNAVSLFGLILMFLRCMWCGR